MKKSTIWLLTILMAVTFVGLLYIEIKYMDDIIKMRDDQFSEGVRRSLYMVSSRLEQEETRYYLEDDVSGAESAALYSQYPDGQPPHLGGISYSFNTFSGLEGTLTIRGDVDKISKLQSDQLAALDRTNAMREAQARLDDRVRYQKGILDEVILKISTQAINRPVLERVDSTFTREIIAQELANNGINIPFRFAVVNRNGIPVYATEGFPNITQSEDNTMFVQALFPNDPANKKIFLKVYFPSKAKYILKSVRFLIPAFAFTLVLLIVFVYTIILAFRQKKLNEMKTDFINNMTHEFKTPISTISLAAQMLNDDSVRKSPGMLQHISSIINDETKRLRFQVEKVLQMSMFDRKKAVFKKKRLDLNEMVENIANSFTLRVEHTGGKIYTEIEAIESALYVDEVHFQNVINNLLDNAVKYRKPDQPINIYLRTWNDDNHLYLSVRDTGLGIKKENLKKVFDKFYRVHTGNVHDVKGFGLGLAYVKKIIMLHNGDITIDSELGKGTKFTIKLPVIKD